MLLLHIQQLDLVLDYCIELARLVIYAKYLIKVGKSSLATKLWSKKKFEKLIGLHCLNLKVYWWYLCSNCPNFFAYDHS